MLVSLKHRKLVLNLRNPEPVLASLRKARQVEYKGRRLVVTPHRLDEVRYLRSVGINAPGPIRYHYKFSGDRTPFAHQIETSDFLTLNPRAFCLNDMGTGKTLSVLWAYDFLRHSNTTNGSLLVIGPLSTLERTWADEVFRNFPHLNVSVLHGSAMRRLKLLNQKVDIYVLNHDGLHSKSLVTALMAKIEAGEISVLAIDELATFRNATTNRWKALQKLTKLAPVVWGMTGTPIPNEPTDAWAQIRLIRPDRVPRWFGEFRDTVMRPIGAYKFEARPNALEHVHQVMQPSIRFKRSDCIDLPPTTYVTRKAELTDDQKRMYREMMQQFKTEFDNGLINAVNEAAKRMKLLQIVCGVAYSGEDDITIPAEHRLELLDELIEQSEGKIIVFVPFVGALMGVAEHVGKQWATAVVHGGVTKAERDEIYGSFQRATNPRVIVAQPSTMSHGLTLTEASTIIWFAPINSAETYQQACMRIVRPGQVRNTLIVNIEGSPLERAMYARLERRENAQGTLLDMFGEVDALV